MSQRFPFPVIPSGWYVIAMSEELHPGQILPRRNFGRDLALFRTTGGAARVIDAYCPHMGAHLGHQGKVEGEELTCQFHGLTYGEGGRCVRTLSGDRPPSASLHHWLVREQSGMILVWHDAANQLPSWEVPPLTNDGFTAIAWRRFSFRGHPQETTENSVDFGHFLNTHGFPAATSSEQVKFDGPVLFARYGIERSIQRTLFPGVTMSIDFDVTARGLGYSQVDGTIHQLATDIRFFVLPIPIDTEHIELVLGSSCRGRFRPMSRMLRSITLRMLCNEVGQDIAVWQHKTHLLAPALTQSEAAVAGYRRWCQQFYPQLDESAPHEHGD